MLFPITLALFLSAPALAEVPDWHDEFQYKGLPDPGKWGYEEGFVRNNELQYYTMYDSNDVYVDGEYLRIIANKRAMKNRMYASNPKSWKEVREFSTFTSASINTKNRFSFNGGILEIRAKLPIGSGVWPAFWMLGDNIDTVGYPECGEIDLMEYFGRAPKTVTSNIHLKLNGKRASFPGKLESKYPLEEFNIYKIKWTDGKMDFSINDLVYHSFNYEGMSNHPFAHKFFLLLNFAVGGNPSGYVDESNYPKELVVDYVRYYKSTD